MFVPGKMTILLDGGAGSSGKGKLASFVGENSDNWSFCCNTFMSNAAHWVVLDDGTKYLYQSLNSVAHLKDKYDKMYICGGAVTELPTLLKEIDEHNLTPRKLGIDPMVAIVQDKDIEYERGTCDFDGNELSQFSQSDCMKIGSTLHGVGAARARRILRRSDVLLARDISELSEFICDTKYSIMDRLDAGESGLMEIAQGYQLSYLLPQFYPRCTSRNCTVAAGLDDASLPPSVVGNVILNFRTFPIRVNSNKWVHKYTHEVLTSDKIKELRQNGQEYLIELLEGDSGACYPDQREITWDEVTEQSGIKDIDPNQEIREETSLTKLERRVYTFSYQNMMDAIRFNDCQHTSINFMNYVDARLNGVRGGREKLTDKAVEWLNENARDKWPTFIGTGPKTNDMVML